MVVRKPRLVNLDSASLGQIYYNGLTVVRLKWNGWRFCEKEKHHFYVCSTVASNLIQTSLTFKKKITDVAFKTVREGDFCYRIYFYYLFLPQNPNLPY